VVATHVQDDSVATVLRELLKLFSDEPSPGTIVLSTVHRAKGGEWDVVFILRPDLLPFPAAKPNEDGTVSDELQQEYNACYVAATRPRRRLYYVENWPFGNMARRALNFDREDILAVTQYPDADPESYLTDPVTTQYTEGAVLPELDDASITEPVPYDKGEEQEEAARAMLEAAAEKYNPADPVGALACELLVQSGVICQKCLASPCKCQKDVRPASPSAGAAFVDDGQPF
jgi:hypothetical protein